MRLNPVDTVSAEDFPAARRSLVLDSTWASLTGAFSGGVILVAFALSLGANPQQIGLLAAIPLIAQLVQLPATLWIERVRQRRRIGVLTITAARVAIALLALLPFIPGEPNQATALDILIGAQIVISVLNAAGGCAVNSWLHQLVPQAALGNFFARRLFWGTASAAVGTLAAGYLIENLPVVNRLHSYSVAFALAGVTGFLSSYFLARAPEPRMPLNTVNAGWTQQLVAPFKDLNFRRLLVFLAAWNVASNLAVPFLSMFLIKQLGYPLTAVTALGVISQTTNALTLYAWGRLSDRLSNKAILAAALPVHFICLFSLVFGDAFRNMQLQFVMLVVIHALLGIAGGGIGLATGNLGLKLAPKGHSTSYLAAIGIVSAFFGGLTPIVAGSLAHWFEQAELAAVIRWVYSESTHELTILRFAHWEFLFALSAIAGLYVMHALSRVQEGADVSERVVIQEFALEAMRSATNLSSVTGFVGGAIFPFFDRLLGRPGAKTPVTMPTAKPLT